MFANRFFRKRTFFFTSKAETVLGPGANLDEHLLPAGAPHRRFGGLNIFGRLHFLATATASATQGNALQQPRVRKTCRKEHYALFDGRTRCLKKQFSVLRIFC